ncbi:hypothetical protein [Halalkalicoccus tibetensis]|uniref:Uncharacterized protein n=1 Tax=Halalkalicoccus tibetensis TaxID=175632 RepID=A0ABD5V2E7_9EURY
MDWPNLLCPDCDYQFQAIDISGFNCTSFQTLVDSCSCRSCGVDIHPEDALLEYFTRIPITEIGGRPIQLGSRASIGTIELEVGKTKEVPLIGGNSLDIGLSLLAETDRPSGQSITDLQGVALDWYPRHLLVENSVIIDIVQPDEGKIAFVTSELNSNAPDRVTVAYNYHSRPSDIEQPPWIDLLLNAVRLFYQSEWIAMLPLLISAYDNHLARQLRRTLEAEGKSVTEIEQFLQNDYRGWKDRSKEGLEKVTSHRFSTYSGSLYDNFHTIREERNNKIIHVDSDDDVADISVQESRDYFTTTIESILTIHEICNQKRINI